jgi:mannitol/fructose-specific phosphotransferase system IIA component (Ntr-type)
MAITIAPPVQSTTLFVPELGPRKKDAALHHLVARAAAVGIVREPDAVRDAIALRERLGPTALGKGVAIPNARSLGVVVPRLVFARSTRGIEWDAPDELPVHLVLLALSPADTPLDAHLDFVARLAAATRLSRQRSRLLDAVDGDSVAALVEAAS